MRGLVAAACSVGLLACVVVDDQRSTLSVELFWDAIPESNLFVPASCREAGVDVMDWELLDERGRVVEAATERCADGIDIFDLDIGEYELVVTGFDFRGDLLWSVSCAGLDVFDRHEAYDCDVFGF